MNAKVIIKHLEAAQEAMARKEYDLASQSIQAAWKEAGEPFSCGHSCSAHDQVVVCAVDPDDAEYYGVPLDRMADWAWACESGEMLSEAAYGLSDDEDDEDFDEDAEMEEFFSNDPEEE